MLRIVDFTGRHVVHSALWQIKVKLTKYVVIVFNRGEHTLCNDTSWKTVIWIWAEIQLVVNCNLGIKTWGKPCMFLSHEFLVRLNLAAEVLGLMTGLFAWISLTALSRTHIILSYLILSYRIVSYHIISYHIISYHIISYDVVIVDCWYCIILTNPCVNISSIVTRMHGTMWNAT